MAWLRRIGAEQAVTQSCFELRDKLRPLRQRSPTGLLLVLLVGGTFIAKKLLKPNLKTRAVCSGPVQPRGGAFQMMQNKSARKTFSADRN